MQRGHAYVVELTLGAVCVGTFMCCDDGARPVLIMDSCQLDLLEVERVMDLTDFFGSLLLPPEVVAHIVGLSAG